MPRPLINTNSKLKSSGKLSATQQQQTTRRSGQMSKMEVDRMLRKKRSKKYMESMGKLDAGGHNLNPAELKNIIDDIIGEFPEIEFAGMLLGTVSKCYLGEPYEVHNINIDNQIICHYKRGEKMPGRLEAARSVALRGGYAFIEVYSDCFRAIDDYGNVAVIPG